jgi:hypothetical protein
MVQKADGKAVIDYGFHLIISDLPDDWLPDRTLVREASLPSSYSPPTLIA